MPASVFDTSIWRRPVVWPTRHPLGTRYETFQSASALPAPEALGVEGAGMI